MTHPNRRVTKTLAGPRIAALILLLVATASGGFLIHADIADHEPPVASYHPDQAGNHFFPGVPLGHQFQVKATEEDMHDDHQLFPGVPLGHQFQIGTPLGSHFQAGQTADSTANAPTKGIAVTWRTDG